MAKITFIDDSSATLELPASVLRGEGRTAQMLARGVGAETKLSEDAPNLVLLDVVMTERNGYEYCAPQNVRARPKRFRSL